MIAGFKKFQKTGSVCDDRLGMAATPHSADTEENLALVEEFFQREPTESVRRASVRLGISRTSLQRIMRSLTLSPYKIQANQFLTDDHIAQHFEFAQEMLERF